MNARAFLDESYQNQGLPKFYSTLIIPQTSHNNFFLKWLLVADLSYSVNKSFTFHPTGLARIWSGSLEVSDVR